MLRNDTSSITAWAVAFLSAVLLNLAIFGLMPGLQTRNGTGETRPSLARRIDVVRLKRPESPVQKKVKKEQAPPEKKKVVTHGRSMVVKRAPMQKFDLPFEFNPRLPAHAGDLKLPPMASGPLVAPGFKSEYGLSELDHPLMPTVRVPPVYPMHAKRRGIQGFVRVGFLVTDQGKIEDIRIVSSEPEKIFDKSVIRCVSAWRFKPGTYRGEPVNTRVETTIRFELK